MSDESQSSKDQQARHLQVRERELIKQMLSRAEIACDLEAKLGSALVEDMHDGGMGSIRFVSSGHPTRRFGRTIAEANYIDEDGVLVSISINVDDENRLYEIDFWKVDFSPLKRYPCVSDIEVKGSV